MFNIVIPIIMVFIFIIFYNKNLNETFENTLSPSETRKKEIKYGLYSESFINGLIHIS